MHHHRARIGADDASDLVAEVDRHVPPPFGPGAHTTRRPSVGVVVQAIVSCFRHRAETVRDQIDSLL